MAVSLFLQGSGKIGQLAAKEFCAGLQKFNAVDILRQGLTMESRLALNLQQSLPQPLLVLGLQVCATTMPVYTGADLDKQSLSPELYTPVPMDRAHWSFQSEWTVRKKSWIFPVACSYLLTQDSIMSLAISFSRCSKCLPNSSSGQCRSRMKV